MVLLNDMSLGELILKCCDVGVPVLLGGLECPASIGLISFDSVSLDPYETNVQFSVSERRETNCVVLLLILSFECYLTVRCTGFRYLCLYYHQLLLMLVYSSNLLLRCGLAVPGWNYYLMTQFF